LRPARLAAFVLFVPAMLLWSAQAKVDPSSGTIRIISIGESFYPETRLPFMLRADPRIAYQPVPTNWYEGTFQAVGRDREDAEKFLRLYMPRTYERFVEGYDVILLSDFEVDIVSPEQFAWMELSVRQDGMGMGKYEMNYDPAHWRTFDLFRTLAVYPVFPTELIWGHEFTGVGLYAVRMEGTGRPHPVLDLPNMQTDRIPVDIGSGKAGYEEPRPGAVVIARYAPNDEPGIVLRSYGEGNAMTCVPGHDTIDWSLSEYWPYTIDFWINQAWYLAGLEIPSDLGSIHNLRQDFLSYSSQRTLALSTIDFVERFGARTRTLYEALAETDGKKRKADEWYRRDRLDESLAMMEEALKGLQRVAAESVKAKSTVLIWIYGVEWMAVTGTTILAGLILWTLMIRRRLYREVGLTRVG